MYIRNFARHIVAILLLSAPMSADKIRDMFEYTILKHIPHQGPVQCRSRQIENRRFLLCTWDRRKALFLIESPSRYYAVNGTARDPRFTRYDEISPYPGHDIDIPSVLSKFER